jgi:hypothetical protein
MKENKIKTKKQILKNRRKAKKTNKKKRKIESGVAYDSMTTKKPPSFRRFAKQNKKDLQVRSTPLRNFFFFFITDLAQSMGKKYYSTPPLI